MAQIRIRWRHIWRNLPMVVVLVQQLMRSWEPVKEQLHVARRANPVIQEFVDAADQLYHTIVRRRK